MSSPAEELALQAAAQERLLAELAVAQRQIEEGEVERDRLVGELRRRATPWARIGEVVGMNRQNAWRKWAGVVNGYECVAVHSGVIVVTCWAPVGSSWRPAWAAGYVAWREGS